MTWRAVSSRPYLEGAGEFDNLGGKSTLGVFGAEVGGGRLKADEFSQIEEEIQANGAPLQNFESDGLLDVAVRPPAAARPALETFRRSFKASGHGFETPDHRC